MWRDPVLFVTLIGYIPGRWTRDVIMMLRALRKALSSPRNYGDHIALGILHTMCVASG